jgi:hypothetical protein
MLGNTQATAEKLGEKKTAETDKRKLGKENITKTVTLQGSVQSSKRNS